MTPPPAVVEALAEAIQASEHWRHETRQVLAKRMAEWLAANPDAATAVGRWLVGNGTGWTAAMEDPAFVAALDRGLADLAAGRVRPLRATEPGPPVAPDLDALEATLHDLDEEAKSARRLSGQNIPPLWLWDHYAAGIELSIRRVRAALNERGTPE